MFRRSAKRWAPGTYLEHPTNWARVARRRKILEQRRISESAWKVPPIEPTHRQAIVLYRQMLKEGHKTLVLTDKNYYKRMLRQEFEVTARQTSSRVRGMMYEKGKWMLTCKLGGLL